jgi:predicted dehydrogenase
VGNRSDTVRWGIIGCGDVTERKSGPGFQKARGSALVAVMRRDRAKAEDYAHRHGVARAYTRAADLIADPNVDAVYVATPPSTHRAIALEVAAAHKPCLVEKPMALTQAECVDMRDGFARAGVPLWVAYYRRALPRFLTVRDRLASGVIGTPVSFALETLGPPGVPGPFAPWRVDPSIGGAGLFFDVGSHAVDLVDFLFGPVTRVAGFAVNTGGAYAAEDATAAAFEIEGRLVGTGIWNFNASRSEDRLTIQGSAGTIVTTILGDGDVLVEAGGSRQVLAVRNPEHVHQPLIETIVDELQGRGRCESTAESGVRAARVLDECVRTYYAARDRAEAARRP